MYKYFILGIIFSLTWINKSDDKNGRDRYLWGAFPMGNLFIIWSETMKYRTKN